MHELFMTAVISNANFERATAVLQGLCAMSAWQSTHRVLHFAGSPQSRGLPGLRSLLQPQVPSPQTQQCAKLWQELHQHLSRQSYIIQIRYEVFRDKDFGVPDGDGSGNSNP